MAIADATFEAWAEDDPERLRKRLARLTLGELSTDEVDELVEGRLSLIDKLSAPAQQAVLALVADPKLVRPAYEAIQGNTIDFVPIAYLDVARLAARSVGRVVFRAGQAHGTGVLVSDSLLLTNNHVTESIEQARTQAVQFNYERDILGRAVDIAEFALDPDRFFLTSDKTELDYTLVAVGARLDGGSQLTDFGSRPLSGATDKHALRDHVTIVQHPNGDYKQIVLRENQVIGRGERGTTLLYGTDTLPGSSGSPVFNDQYDLIALHHAGAPTDARLDDGQAMPKDANEGIRISAIVTDLVARRSTLSAAQRTLLDQAMTDLEGGPSELPRIPTSRPNGVTGGTVVVPLQITVSVANGGVAAITDGATAHDAATPQPVVASYERNKPPSTNYGNRRGYDPDFLGIPLPLPKLNAELKKAAARLVDDKTAMVLDYHHFSLIVHATRRMPIVTAVNINGPTWKQINRTDRAVTNPFEAAAYEGGETWYPDERIAPEAQSNQKDYDVISGFFDRGHMVRREDAQWGNADRALAAMDDTFHFTNCCPQNWRFNQKASFWQGIENYVLNGMRRAPERVTVFTGPIFAKNDPVEGKLKVPWTFWKIVARIDENDELRTTGFIASQRKMLNDPREAISTREWPIDPDEPIADYQAKITEIARRTGLDFLKVLEDADTFDRGFESLGSNGDGLARLQDPADANW
jgi:endonuclease G